MLLKYFYDQRLAHASYMVGCQATGEAIVVDPGRNIEQYLAAAEDNEMEIVAATETHIHADFVSGARELAKRIGAKLYLSDEGDENWKYENLEGYDYQLVYDNDKFMVGNIEFEVMHSPGHTPEHISFVVTDTPNKDGAGGNRPMGVFTGDFVFVGDIGRPDLLEEAAGIMGTAEPGARRMFHSLQRFAELPDYVQVWPAHGAGSACGKALGAIPSSTVGYEKIFNWAFQIDDEDEFVEALLAGQPEAPVYFAMMKKLNKIGAPILGHLPRPQEMDMADLERLLAEGAKIVDARENEMFALNHIAGTLNIPFTNSFTNWAGWLLGYEEPFYLLVDEDKVEEVMQALVSIGLDNAGGFFDTEVLAHWAHEGKELQSYEISTPDKMADQILTGAVTMVDVRGKTEYDEGHIPGAQHFMLGRLPQTFEGIPTDKPIVLSCQTGGRSAIGASILQSKGLTRVINLMGGYRDWAAAKLPTETNGH
jgi:hydroxyacylglutathione hydrolase